MIYQWAEGSRIRLDPQAAGEELERITKECGGLRADDVIEEARPETAPLHSAFDWDDTLAADKWRKEQAGHIIRCIKVTVEVPDHEEPMIVRAYQNVIETINEESERLYVSVQRALAEPDLKQQVLSAAIKEARAWQKKYREYRELSEVFEAIERTAQLVPV